MSQFEADIKVDPDGYEWVAINPESLKDPDNWDVTLVLSGKTAAKKKRKAAAASNSYDPFEDEPALYRIFAAVEPTQSAIVEFANQYGELSEPAASLYGMGTSLGEWKRAIARMRKGIAIADEAARTKTARAKKSMAPIVEPLMRDLLQTVSLWLTPKPWEEGFRVKATVTGLGNVLKVQLAEAIAGNKQYRSCEQCSKPFELSPEFNRADRLFCSDNCRVKAYQGRKRRAIALRQEGKSLRQIVRETNTDIETARRWLEGAESKARKKET